MSRDRPPFVAQGTWRSGRLFVWGWNGVDTAPSSWLYSGFGRHASGIGLDWHDSPVSFGELSRFTLELPDDTKKPVSAVALDPYGAAVWLSALPEPDQVSESLAWFASLTRLATQIVNAGNLTPIVDAERQQATAVWLPILDDHITEQLRYASSVAPAACRNGSIASTETILEQLVDGLARALLEQSGWRPEVGRKRDVETQARRAVFASLAKRDPTIRSGNAEFQDATLAVGALLDRQRRRLHGEPIVVPRVRLTLPDDALDPWTVSLELVADTNPGQWCRAADVWESNPLAVDLAGGVDRLDSLAETVTATVDELANAEVFALDRLALEARPDSIELDLDEADEFLEIAPQQLADLHIELIGPEQLVRSSVRVTGSASEQPSDDRKRRFGKEAIVEWSAVIDDTPISEADLARAAEAGRTLMRAGHRWVRIDTESLRRAHTFVSDHANATASPVQLLHWNAGTSGDQLDIELASPPDDAATLDRAMPTGWVRALLDGFGDDQLEEEHEPAGFEGELRHYQRRALTWLRALDRLGLGGVLADDMGLGKTATALAHMLQRSEGEWSGPHLVVSPLSVVHNWEAEARRFTPSLSTIVHHGSGRSQGDLSLFGLADANIVVTTYGLLSRDLETLGPIEWSTVVLDEAQNIKNPNTKAAKAVRQLNAAQKLALTGTPVENRLSELWAILDAVNPGLLGTLPRFRDRYASVIERNDDPVAAADAARRLRSITAPFVLRRTKSDKTLLPDLPDKIEQIAYATLTAEQATMYQQVVDQLLVDAKQLDGMQRRGRVLAALTRLKQICNHPVHALKDGSRLIGRSGKLQRFDELIDDIFDVDERGLIFTQFREMGDLLQSHLQGRSSSTIDFLHGGVSKARRDEMVRRFQSDDGPPLLLVSLKAGGTGLNLTAASHVIHYDRWWNPAVEDQATDRAWRFGQTQTVMVHKLVCQGTVEERIGEVIDEKRALADAVVGTGEGWISELSTDELAALVALEPHA